LAFPPLRELGPVWAAWVFDQAPALLLAMVHDWRTGAALLGLFGVKELVSLWPSSDMRLMHRQERGRSGFLGAFAALRLKQVLWDALASAVLFGGAALWALSAFVPGRLLWRETGWAGWLAVSAGWMALLTPALLAGLSYSSKLAILSRGTFGEKFGLFLRLFWDWRLFWRSWVFCVARLGVEGLFALAVPVWAFATLDSFWLRVGIAALFAAPVYSYVKMATFKFFLEMYKPFRLVHEEYRSYYTTYRL
jgi:hypothetical protein